MGAEDVRYQDSATPTQDTGGLSPFRLELENLRLTDSHSRWAAGFNYRVHNWIAA